MENHRNFAQSYISANTLNFPKHEKTVYATLQYKIKSKFTLNLRIFEIDNCRKYIFFVTLPSAEQKYN